MARRFVILLHTGHGADHYDLMIEREGALATWQFAENPAEAIARAGPQGAAARRLADHRAAYLDYEGPVSRGRGRVRRVDEGPCDVTEDSPDRWRVEFHGRTLRGAFELRRGGQDDWTFLPVGA